MAGYQALYRKWRPRTFEDVVGQSHITETLARQVREGKLSHAYLFTGTRGTGKTSCAKILARAVNCAHPVNGSPCNECEACRGIESGAVMDVLELDAASNNGVDQVRALRDEAVYSPAAVRKRVYIIDEVHMLSNAAFNALLKILEEPPEHLMFILATTEVNKVLPTIKSRCQQFAFKRISPTDIAQRLKYVAGEEGIPLTGEGAALLARLADGGMRDALSLLDQCATGQGELGETEILAALGLAGNVETAALMADIAGHDTGAALERLDRLYAAGKDVGSLLNELSSLTRDLLIRKTAPRGGSALLTGGYDEATLRGLSEKLNTPQLARNLGLLQAVGADLSRSANRRADAELCLIRLCDETLDDSGAGLCARLARLEEAMAVGLPARPATPAETPAPVKRPAPEPPTSPAEAAPPARRLAEDLPPWESAPAPAEEPAKPAAPERTEPSAPPPAEDTAPQTEPHPPETEKTTVPASPAPADFWPRLVEALRGKIPMGEYTFLKRPGAAQGVVDGGVLTVGVESDMARSLLTKPGILANIAKEAKVLLGGEYRVALTVGTPPPAQAGEEHDKLDDLLANLSQLDNMTIKE